MRRLARFDAWSAIAPTLALTGGLGWLWAVQGLPPFQAVALRSVQTMAAASAASFLALVLLAWFHRRWNRLLAGLAGLVLLGYGGWWAAAHCQSVLSLGVGEPSASFEGVQRGPLGKLPKVAISVLDAPQDAKGRFSLGLDDRTVSLGTGMAVSQDGFRLRLVSVAHAPRFFLETAQGIPIDGALVKLRLGDPPDPFIQLGVHPHRFYVSRAEREQDADPGKAPDRLALRVVRGKVTVWKGTAEKGKAVPFESLALRYEDGAPWVRIEVRKEPPAWLWLALAAGLGGAAAVLR